MEQEQDRIADLVRQLVVSELSFVVAQPVEVISPDDHLVHVIGASANDLAYDFIPFVQASLGVRLAAEAWAQACTAGDVCALLVHHCRQRSAGERAALLARLARAARTANGQGVSQTTAARQRYYWRRLGCNSYQPSYWWSPFARARRLLRFWRSWQPANRRIRRALLSGPLFRDVPDRAPQTGSDDADATILLMHDVVFWVLEYLMDRPRAAMALDDDLTAPPYIESAAFREYFVADIESLLDVSVSNREWSRHRTIRQLGTVLARHFKAKAADEQMALAAQLRQLRVEHENRPPSAPWWAPTRWKLPRWPA